MTAALERELTLGNVAMGAVPELFDAALSDVLENIDDPNFKAEQKREIVIKIAFKPDSERHSIVTSATVSSKLADREPATGLMFMGRVQGELKAVTHDTRQDGLFDTEEEEPGEPDITPEKREASSE